MSAICSRRFLLKLLFDPHPVYVCMYIIQSRQSSSRQLLCCYGLLPVCSSSVRWTLVDRPTAPAESCITYLNKTRNPVCVPYTTSGRTKESDYLLALCRTCVLFVYHLRRVLWATWHTKISLTQEIRKDERIFFYTDWHHTCLLETRRCHIFGLLLIIFK